VALAVVVTVGSGLMLRSFDLLMSVDTGLDASDVLTFRANPPAGRYPDGEAFQTYYNSLQERLDGLPGVSATGGINLLPGTNGKWSFPTHPEGVDAAQGSAVPSVNFRAVRPGYFETVEMPLERGRLISSADRADSENVLLVNEAFVKRFWPGEGPLGRTVSLFSATGTPSRVVGVVGDVRQHGRARAARAEMYFPHAQMPWDQMAMWMMVRFSDDDPLAHAGAVREAVWSVDADVPITGLEELDSVFGRSAQTTAFLTLLLTYFGGLSLLLGALGVFSITSYLVQRRAPEFGVRIALGSTRMQVLRSGLSKILLPVAGGLALGVGGGAVTADALTSVLYAIEPTAAAAFVGVTLVLGTAALLAALVPAWRASRVDPVAVLNRE
jgi:predicted permease